MHTIFACSATFYACSSSGSDRKRCRCYVHFPLSIHITLYCVQITLCRCPKAVTRHPDAVTRHLDALHQKVGIQMPLLVQNPDKSTVQMPLSSVQIRLTDRWSVQVPLYSLIKQGRGPACDRRVAVDIVHSDVPGPGQVHWPYMTRELEHS